MSPGEVLRRRLSGSYVVDEWGLDLDLVELVSPLCDVRWRVNIEHADRLPGEGPAVLVFNRRFGLSEPVVVARAVRLTNGRVVRTVGVPDVAPVGPMLRRLGGVLDRGDEIAGLLRAGELVSIPVSREVRARGRAGALPPVILEAALPAGVPVFPIAVIGREVGRTWRVIVGRPVTTAADEGPRAADKLVESTRKQLQELLGGVG